MFGCFFFSPAVCALLNETDRYTAALAKVHSAVGRGVRGAIFHDLILYSFSWYSCRRTLDWKTNNRSVVLLQPSNVKRQEEARV